MDATTTASQEPREVNPYEAVWQALMAAWGDCYRNYTEQRRAYRDGLLEAYTILTGKSFGEVYDEAADANLAAHGITEAQQSNYED